MKKTKTQVKAIESGQDLMQMYQAGFYDCWRHLKRGRLNFIELNLSCLKLFEKRFMKKINKEYKKARKKYGNSIKIKRL